jgi:L-malate glycosyltransferase
MPSAPQIWDGRGALLCPSILAAGCNPGIRAARDKAVAPRAVHQLVAGFAKGDAISNEALAMRAIFRGWGVAADVFCESRRILPELRREARDIGECAAACEPDGVALLHLSIGSAVNEVFAGLRCRKAILYHNVTPPDYFRAVQPKIAHDLEQGLRQARALAGAAEVNLADSRFNAEELRDMGYANVGVLPLILDRERLGAAPDRCLLRELQDGRVNALFVGRCAPNKKIEDVLEAFDYFQRFVEPDSRFVHAGSYAGTERYHSVLLARVRELRLANVVFAGAVPQAALNACYRAAHVFVSMSEHEGFCIPLIESMWHNVPVLAYAAGAVPETLDGAGCLFRDKNFGAVGEMMGRLAREGAPRTAVLARQRERVDRFMARDPAGELRAALAPVL